MTDLTDLIARVESAEHGSFELDRQIAVAAGVADALSGDAAVRRGDSIFIPRPYSVSLDAKLPGEEIVAMKRLDYPDHPSRWVARCKIQSGKRRGEHVEGIAATEPLARRAAALRAIQHEREHR